MKLDGAWAASWMRESAARIADASGQLSMLDRAIGDGDHGDNLDRGFTAVVGALDALADDATAGEVLRLAATTLISTVGGAAGPLFGTAFLRAAGSAGGAVCIDEHGIAEMLSAARDGIAQRGKAAPGDKTMIDVWTPAAEAAREAALVGRSANEVLAAAATAAETGAAATDSLVAHRGRASYLGDRAVGHRDPGAVSSALILRAAADCAQGGTRDV